MWASPRTSTAEREQLEDRAHVDLGRLEQDLAERPAEALVVERDVGEGLARERVAVGVQARGGEADDDIPGRDRCAGDDPVERHQADRAAGELDPVDDVADLGDLAAGDLDPGELGAPAQTLPDRPQMLGVGGGAEDEVDQRDRLGADADQVVDVHRDAVDADRLEPAEPARRRPSWCRRRRSRTRSRSARRAAARSRSGPAAARPATACRCRSSRAGRRARRRRHRRRSGSTPPVYASWLIGSLIQRQPVGCRPAPARLPRLSRIRAARPVR